MLRTLLLSTSLFLTASLAKAQEIFHYRIQLNPVGSGFRASAATVATPDSFGLSSRMLPGTNVYSFRSDSTVVKGDSVFGSIRIMANIMRFRGRVQADTMQFNLFSARDGRPLGHMWAGKKAPAPINYRQQAAEILGQTRKLIFDTSYLQNKAWESFAQFFTMASGVVESDLELMMAFYKNISTLPFTHYEITKKTQADYEDMLRQHSDNANIITLTEPAAGTALLKVGSFGGDGKLIDKLMQEVVKKGYQNLIIDLRGNSGGGVGAAMELTKYLSPSARPAGAIVTRQWFNEHAQPPTFAQYSELSAFSEGSTAKVVAQIPYIKGFYLQIKPAATVYTGKVILLTDGRTGSTTEPFVYGLQYFKRATVIGAKTSGAVLSKIPVQLSNDYVLLVPMADYFTIDGKRLDKVGVEPDIAVAPAEALTTALAHLQTLARAE